MFINTKKFVQCWKGFMICNFCSDTPPAKAISRTLHPELAMWGQTQPQNRVFEAFRRIPVGSKKFLSHMHKIVQVVTFHIMKFLQQFLIFLLKKPFFAILNLKYTKYWTLYFQDFGWVWRFHGCLQPEDLDCKHDQLRQRGPEEPVRFPHSSRYKQHWCQRWSEDHQAGEARNSAYYLQPSINLHFFVFLP